MVKRYPVVPTLWNYLAVAYQSAGKHKKARSVEREMFDRHPDYLFSKVAEARQRVESGRSESVPEVLGNSMTLREALGHDRPPHLSEWKHFYAMVAEWHIEEGRLDHAAKLVEAMECETHTEEVVHVLNQKLILARLDDFRLRMAMDAEKRVDVDQGKVPKVRKRSPKPEGLLPEVEALYHHGLELSREQAESILALPREQAVGQLRQVLRDAIDNGPHYFHFPHLYQENELDFGLHALWLLGELKAQEALPEVLDFLSQHGEVLGEAFGDMLSWPLLVGFIGTDLTPLTEWMRRPGLSVIGRSSLSEAVAVVATHRPQLRDQAVEFLCAVLELMRDGKPGDGVLSTSLISQMIGDLIGLRAVEQEELIRDLYARNLVHESFTGTLEQVLEELTSLADPPRRIPGMVESYEHICRVGPDLDDPDFEDDLDDFDDLFGPGNSFPPSNVMMGDFGYGSAPEVGRNDPCPCGSGKKYKKCCLK